MLDQDDDPHSSYPTYIEMTLIAVATISSLISLLIPALYHIKKQCRQHPTNLISKISLLEALSNYNVILIAVNIYKFEGYVNVTDIFDLITFNQPEEPTATQFCQINYALYMVLELSSIAYNIAFSIDLFVTLKFPFYAGKKRTKFYNLFAVIFLLSTMPEAIIQAQDICENEYHNKAVYKVPIIFIIVLGIFYVLSFFIIIYSYFQTKKIGKVRAQYIRHHRFILLILLSAWVFPLWTNTLIYLGDQTSDTFYVVNLISFITLLLLGAFVNIVRFYHDKFIWERVKKMIMCERSVKIKMNVDDKKHIPQSDIWNLPLAAAVAQLNNQKIVHSLIQVVSYACSEGQIDKMVTFGMTDKKYSNRSKSIATFTAKQKKILDHLNQNNSVVKNQNDLLEKFIEKNVENASLSQIKKISKKTKKFNMFCLNDSSVIDHQQAHKTLKQKTVFAQQKRKKSTTAQFDDQDRKRSRSDIKNHLSLNNQKDLHKLRNQLFLHEQAKSIDYSKKETYAQSNSEMYRLRKDNIQIKVVSHAHQIFSSIRKMNGLCEDQIEESLDLQKNIQQILKAKESLGASGSFFFFSFDHKLIIKTIGEGQDKILLDLLPKYYFHLKKYKDTLLTKIYGLFSVEIAGISKITFILLQNSFYRMQNEEIQFKKYDLKGSTVSREVKDPKADVLKDMNYLKSNDAFIMMDPEDRQRLINQIEADITLLREQNIMDYSLLLGVGVKGKEKSQKSTSIFNEYDIKKAQQQQTQRQNEMNFQRDILKRRREQLTKRLEMSIPHKLRKESDQYEKSWKYIDEYEQISGRIYSISIIDYLQQFNFNKLMELQLKKLFKGGGDISSVDSEYYFFRFMNFVKKIIVPVSNFKKPSKPQVKEKQAMKLNENNHKSLVSSMLEKQKKKTIYQIKLNDEWEDVYIKDE